MSEDKEYDDMMRHDRRGKRPLAKAHLRDQPLRCCYRCEHSEHGYEGEIACRKTTDRVGGWGGQSVYPMQICDMYAEPRPDAEGRKK